MPEVAVTEWKVRRIADVADVTGGGTPSTKDPSNFGGDIPWITPKDLSGHESRFITSGERGLSAQGLYSSGAKKIAAGSVIVSSRAPIGLTAIASNIVTTNQGCRSLTPKSGEVDGTFLYYLISGNTDYLTQHANGTTFLELSGGVFKELEFLFPPQVEQLRIAELLSSIDDALESNKRLERILGRLIHVECHAVFDERKSVEEISLVEAIRLVNGGAFTKGADQRGRMVVRIKELNSGPSSTTVYNSIKVPVEKTVYPGDVLFAWSGSLGVWRWYRDEAIVNQHIFKVLPKAHPVWLGWVHILDSLEEFQDIAAGKATTMGHITQDHLHRAKVPKLTTEELVDLSAKVEPLWDYQLRVGRLLQALQATKDFLLPRLLSGDLRMPEVESPFEEAS